MAGQRGEPSREEVLAWVERIAKYFVDQDGLPLIAGRILGWLTLCDPPEQSAAQIAEAIGASRASLTSNLRLLRSIGFLRQLTKPGDRTVYYRVDDDAWEAVVRRQAASLAALLNITRDGLELVGASTSRAARIRIAHEVFVWLDKVFADAPPPPSASRTRQERTSER
jgi:DNA-binding transcriptional regulator GbsR (MarR family)